MGQMSQLDPASSWPRLSAPGASWTLWGFKAPGAPPSHLPPTLLRAAPLPPDAAGPVGSKAGKGCGEVTGMGGG